MNWLVQVKSGDHTTMATNVTQQMEDAGSGSVALGAGMMLVGVLLGLIWAWLAFFRRSKSPRNGMAGGSGQVRPKVFQFSVQIPQMYFAPIDFISHRGAIRSPVTFCTFFLVSLSYVYARCYEERCWAV